MYDLHEMTPLSWCVLMELPLAVKKLLEAGADPNEPNICINICFIKKKEKDMKGVKFKRKQNKRKQMQFNKTERDGKLLVLFS